MKPSFEQELIQHACLQDAAAMDFVIKAVAYFHAVDDVIDETTTPEDRVRLLIQVGEIYCHPFFRRNEAVLHGCLRNCADLYAQSVAWSTKAPAGGTAWAEVSRHCGLDLIATVADIVGGWQHRRHVRAEILTYNLMMHADEPLKGNKYGPSIS